MASDFVKGFLNVLANAAQTGTETFVDTTERLKDRERETDLDRFNKSIQKAHLELAQDRFVFDAEMRRKEYIQRLDIEEINRTTDEYIRALKEKHEIQGLLGKLKDRGRDTKEQLKIADMFNDWYEDYSKAYDAEIKNKVPGAIPKLTREEYKEETFLPTLKTLGLDLGMGSGEEIPSSEPVDVTKLKGIKSEAGTSAPKLVIKQPPKEKKEVPKKELETPAHEAMELPWPVVKEDGTIDWTSEVKKATTSDKAMDMYRDLRKLMKSKAFKDYDAAIKKAYLKTVREAIERNFGISFPKENR